MNRLPSLLIPFLLASPGIARAIVLPSLETCTTQSQMQPADRDALAQSAVALATRIQANDSAAVRSLTIPEFQQDFSGMAAAIASTAPQLVGAQPQPEQLYLLDASALTKTAAGANPDAQFFCTLNKSPAAAEFSIPQLPPGKYAFAMVRMDSATPWRLSMLLRRQNDSWLLAGLYPKRLSAAGHDGLWYWKQARVLNAGSGATKEQWNAWLFYQEARSLLTPATFIASTNLDKLQDELVSATPPAISSGITPDSPMVVKSSDGTSEFRFTALTVDDSLPNDKIDVAAHIKVDALGDPTAARQRNVAAIAALVAAHPELRRSFHGVWVFADAPGQNPYATELSMSEIR